MILIINTGIGNFKSIKNMLSRVGMQSILSHDVQEIQKADKIILPGIGSFDKGMQALKSYGLCSLIKDKARDDKTKILGICLGMQMLGESSEEGSLPGLGIIKGCVRKFNFPVNKNNLKIPHMGWNYAVSIKENILFSQLGHAPRFYFTHSYWFDCEDKNTLAKTVYGHEFSSAVHSNDNIFGVQFHPEKSHRFGFQLLKNFATC